MCAEQILFVKEQVCYRCGRLSDQGRTCQRCRNRTSLDGALVATHYEVGPVREMIHRLKYGGMTDLNKILGLVLIQPTIAKDWKDWVVVPVPLHTSRLAKRGFNQAELLAQIIARQWKMEYRTRWLRRVRATTAQIDLTGASRRDNVYKSFLAQTDMTGRRVLLIDDVMTTGATLEDCARACKEAGARRVWAAVVARG